MTPEPSDSCQAMVHRMVRTLATSYEQGVREDLLVLPQSVYIPSLVPRLLPLHAPTKKEPGNEASIYLHCKVLFKMDNLLSTCSRIGLSLAWPDPEGKGQEVS